MLLWERHMETTMRGKYLFLFTVVFGLISMSFPVFAQSENSSLLFPDVPENHPSFFAIRELKNLNIIRGFSDGTFRPQNSVSRAEAAAILMKIIHRDGPTSVNEPVFPDVPKESWFFSFVQNAAQSQKIVRGYPDGTFRPGNPVKLEEAAKMVLQTFEFSTKSSAAPEKWYLQFLENAYRMNFFDENPFASLGKPLMRGEFVELVYRAFLASQSPKKTFDITTNWKTLRNEDSFFELKYPFSWEVFRGKKHSAIWKRDTENGQVWFTRILPKSARVTFSLQDAPTCSAKQTIDDTNRQYDETVCIKPGKSLMVAADYGSTVDQIFVKKQIQAVIASIRHVDPTPPSPPPLTHEQKTEKAREQILVEGKGAEILAIFSDKKLFETDAIGVGTGPVDYFYSQSSAITIKYERTSKTILDVRNGKTSQF